MHRVETDGSSHIAVFFKLQKTRYVIFEETKSTRSFQWVLTLEFNNNLGGNVSQKLILRKDKYANWVGWCKNNLKVRTF